MLAHCASHGALCRVWQRFVARFVHRMPGSTRTVALSLTLPWLLFVAATAGGGDAPRRPNVVFIFADDLNNDLGCYGDPVVQSPQLDRLAARGMRFDRAYCQYPVCNPSRSSVLSGLRTESIGVYDNLTPPRSHRPNVAFLPQWFRQHGYRTVKVGKVFHTGDAFEDQASWDIDLRETSEAKSPPAAQIVGRQGHGGIILGVPDEQTWDGYVAHESVTRLESLVAAEEPFFLAVGFRRPHSPYIAPRAYFDLYPPDRMPLAATQPAGVAGPPAIALTYEPGTTPWPANEQQATRAAYYASVSFVDAQVGVVLDALDRLDLWNDSIVLFVSDHGYHLGEHGGLWHKMTLFEESARVPLLFAAPGQRAAAGTPALVELVDIYPTLCELCGLPPPDGLEGTSFAPLLTEPDRTWKSAAFTVVSRGGGRSAQVPLDPEKLGRSMRTARWRLTEWFDGSVELYDHDSDPGEMHNLAADPRYATVRAELSQALTAGWRGALPTEPDGR